MSNGDVSQGRRRFLIGATSVVGGVGVVGAAGVDVDARGAAG